MNEVRQLKQFHEEDNTFHSETIIYFSQCSERKTLSINDLLKLTSDTAVEDYNSRGMSRDVLAENGFAILVSRCSFRFHRLPRENERVEVATREEKNESLQFVRSYEISSLCPPSSKDERGESLISGLSTWILIDLNTWRILPMKRFTLRPPVELSKPHDCLPCAKIAVPESAVLLDERKIRYSDIDGNGHTNNARYGAFIADCLPEEYRAKDFTDFRINFSKEAVLGETLRLFADFNDEQKKITLAGKTDSGTSFESELFYK